MPAQKSKKPAQAPAQSKTVAKTAVAKKAPAPVAKPKASSQVYILVPRRKLFPLIASLYRVTFPSCLVFLGKKKTF